MLGTLIGLGILFATGMLMVFSTAPQLATKQLVSWIIGLAWFYWGKQLSHKIESSTKIVILVTSCILLLTPLFLGSNIRGSHRWINIGPASLQPTEFVKPILMLLVANTNHPYIILLPVLITAMQPDLSSALSILLLAAPSIFYNKRLKKIFLLGMLVVTLLSPIIWQFGLKQYQKDRIYTFLNPEKEALGRGYNVIQSKIAIGAGGFWGNGFRQGTQSQLKFLPEKHTDFIFASLGEELGQVGILVIILAYYLLLKSLLDHAFDTSSKEHTIFTLGICLQIWVQIIANIGMNLGILPVSGIPLPFISVGGSSIMASLFALGIIWSN